jgi:hypothetical protein
MKYCDHFRGIASATIGVGDSFIMGGCLEWAPSNV